MGTDLKKIKFALKTKPLIPDISGFAASCNETLPLQPQVYSDQ
jgi:hypothetical protein